MRKFLVSAAFAYGATSTCLAAEGPKLGMETAPADIAVWSISVQPDGTGLPPGSGTALAGKIVYTDKCQSCHNQDGTGQPFDRLVGGQGSLATAKPLKTIGSFWPYATTLFDYIRRTMPFQAPQSLTDDEVYAVTAYLLSLNGIIRNNAVMNAQTLPTVRMPNRDGFILMYPEPAP